MKKISFILMAAVAVIAAGCKEHIPSIETFPQPAIDFSYDVIDDTYQLDYYVGATIRFYPTVDLTTDCEWNFGDGTPAVVQPLGSETVITHKFATAGTFYVTATANGGKKTSPIYISDIRPIVTLIQDDPICEVKTSYISFSVELPNPDNLPAEYHWSFPEGTTNQNDEAVASFVGTDKELGKVKFAKVGSQTVSLAVKLGDRYLETVKKNVQVALNEPAPTLYYAVKKGNIMALKIPASRTVEGVDIQPYDMGVSAGQHTYNMLYAQGSLYLLDCGRQYVWMDDVDGVNGDGRITVMAPDASTIETMMTNQGGHYLQDPYYGYIEDQYLYYSDRNTGIFKVPLSMRNEQYAAGDLFPYFVQNNYLGYYGRGMSYGSITGCLARVKGAWYWSKTYNGLGIYRFYESDILTAPTTGTEPAPAIGAMLTSFAIKAFVYDEQNDVLYFAVNQDMGAGVYRAKIEDLEPQGLVDPVSSTADLAPYMLTFADGTGITPDFAPRSSLEGEGTEGEYVGICEMALDKNTGDVYFGYRPKDTSKAGLIRYNASTGHLEYMIQGVPVYSCVINPTATKLFETPAAE